MKKLRKISLDGLDYLSKDEKKRLYGGENYPFVTIKTTPPPTTLSITASFEPGPTIEIGTKFNFS